jgi:hypothetical protein
MTRQDNGDVNFVQTNALQGQQTKQRPARTDAEARLRLWPNSGWWAMSTPFFAQIAYLVTHGGLSLSYALTFACWTRFLTTSPFHLSFDCVSTSVHIDSQRLPSLCHPMMWNTHVTGVVITSVSPLLFAHVCGQCVLDR